MVEMDVVCVCDNNSNAITVRENVQTHTHTHTLVGKWMLSFANISISLFLVVNFLDRWKNEEKEKEEKFKLLYGYTSWANEWISEMLTILWKMEQVEKATIQ